MKVKVKLYITNKTETKQKHEHEYDQHPKTIFKSANIFSDNLEDQCVPLGRRTWRKLQVFAAPAIPFHRTVHC